MDVIPDEAYYWLWSRAPSWGYYDHPPMIAWWINISTRLLGATPFAIRLLPLLSVLGVSLAVYATARELSREPGLPARSALFVNATFLIGGGAIFATPDAPSIFFWALAIWILSCIRNRLHPALWLLFGAIAGLGCVSKFTNLFLGPGVLLWLFCDREARRWLASPWLYGGGAVALMVFSPVILWNADHHWVTFAKQFGRIDDGRLAPRYVLEFIAGQFGLLNPLIAVLAATGVLRIVRQRDARSAETFLLLTALPLIIYMIIHAFHDRVQGNWPGPVYPTIALLAAGVVKQTRNNHLRHMASIAAPVGIALPLIALAYLAIVRKDQVPIRSPADLLIGWSGLAAKVDALRQSQHAAWIATADYGLTGEMEYYTDGKGLVQEIIDRDRYAFDKPNPALATQPALLILRDRDKKDAKILACFNSVIPIGTIERSAGPRIIERYHLFKASGAPPDLLSKGCHSD